MVVTPYAPPSARGSRAVLEGAFTTPLGVVVPAVTNEVMRRLEQAWMEAWDAGPLDLARVAGERLAVVGDSLAERAPARVAVVVGRGWNGLAGMQAALALATNGHTVRVVQVAGRWGGAHEPSLTAALRGAGVSVEASRALEPALSEADVVVDAIVGGGLHGRARPWVADAIRAVNGLARRIVSADVPSGLDGDTGVPWGPVVRPTVTLAFGLPRVGLAEARADMSTLFLADLRLPKEALAEVGIGPIDPFSTGPIVRLRHEERDGVRA